MNTADIAARVIASAPMTLDDWLRTLSVPAWLLCLACLAPAVMRLIGRRARDRVRRRRPLRRRHLDRAEYGTLTSPLHYRGI